MKDYRYQHRFYRDWVNAKDLLSTRIVNRETDLQLLTNKSLDREFLEDRLKVYRWQIEEYIYKDHRFLTALKPIEVELEAPDIVKEMSLAAKKANVGPMAAVAGAIAQFLGRDLLKKGYKDVIVENGGDIFLSSRKSRIIRIYTGRAKSWKNLGIKINPRNMPVGICTSSGTISHSLSFGCADCAIILSKDTPLADATATAVANLVKTRHDLKKAIDFAHSIKGISGAIIILKSDLASWGTDFSLVNSA